MSWKKTWPVWFGLVSKCFINKYFVFCDVCDVLLCVFVLILVLMSLIYMLRNCPVMCGLLFYLIGGFAALFLVSK